MITQFINKQLKWTSSLSLLFFLVTVNSCKVGPNYIPPADNIPDTWSTSPSPIEEVSVLYDPPPTLWWEVFNDPLLNKYIQIASDYNNDILQAELNIFQARSIRQVSAAPLYPKISADIDALHLFLSKNGPIDALVAASTPPLGITAPTPPQKFNIFNTFVDASWEIDIFGKTQRSIEAAQAQLESTIEQRNDILISVFGEIVRNYIELRSSQQQKTLLERNVTILERNIEIIQRRYTSGYSNLLDLEQMNIQLNQALAALPTVNTAIYRSIFAISVLTGDLPEMLLEELLPSQELPEIPCGLSIGLRSDLLRRRPDIRQAEKNLAQATANIGVAVASFFPTFTLGGLLGLESLKLKNLFTPNSKMWIDGADISMPIFQGGKLIGNLKITEAQAVAVAYKYQQTVLNALRETETTLVSYNEDVKVTEEIEKLVATNQKLTRLNNTRYSKGLVSQLDSLNSELILNNAELSLLQSKTLILLDLVTLYKALGGGWEPFSLEKC